MDKNLYFIPPKSVQSRLVLIFRQVKFSRKDVDLFQSCGHPRPVFSTFTAGKS